MNEEDEDELLRHEDTDEHLGEDGHIRLEKDEHDEVAAGGCIGEEVDHQHLADDMVGLEDASHDVRMSGAKSPALKVVPLSQSPFAFG